MSSGPHSSQPEVLGFDGVNTRAPWENEMMRMEWDSAERAAEKRLAGETQPGLSCTISSPCCSSPLAQE